MNTTCSLPLSIFSESVCSINKCLFLYVMLGYKIVALLLLPTKKFLLIKNSLKLFYNDKVPFIKCLLSKLYFQIMVLFVTPFQQTFSHKFWINLYALQSQRTLFQYHERFGDIWLWVFYGPISIARNHSFKHFPMNYSYGVKYRIAETWHIWKKFYFMWQLENIPEIPPKIHFAFAKSEVLFLNGVTWLAGIFGAIIHRRFDQSF